MSPKNTKLTAVAIREAKRMNGDIDVIETDVTNTGQSPQIEDEISPHKQWLDDHDMTENVLPSTREERNNRDTASRVPRATVMISKKCFRM